MRGMIAVARRPLTGVALAGVCIVLGLALTYSPWLAAGVTVGLLVFALALSYPLPILGALLATGAVDLSFLTGGYKALLQGEGGLDMNGIRLIGVVIALAAIVAVDRSVLKHAFARYGRWFLIFLVYAAGTLTYSVSPVDGLRLLLKIAYPFLIFVVVLGVARTSEDLERLADWALVGAAIMAVVVNPLYVLAGRPGAAADAGARIGTFGMHENPFSFYLLAALLLAFVRFLSRRQWRYIALSLVLAAWMVLTFTRITLAATLLGLLAIGMYEAVARRQYRYIALGTLLGAAIAAVLGPVVLQRTLGYVPDLDQLLKLLRSPEALVQSMNWQGRQVIWAIIWAHFRTSPWLGTGLGSTTAFLVQAFSRGGIAVAHNEYLRLTAETGLVGAALFAVAVLQWLRGTLGALKQPERPVRELGLAALAALVAWTVISFTDNPFDYYAAFTQYVAFYCAGAIAAAQIERGRTAQAEDA